MSNLFHGKTVSTIVLTVLPNEWCSLVKRRMLTLRYFRFPMGKWKETSDRTVKHCIWLHFYRQMLVIDLQFFKCVKDVLSINQMHLFWLLNVKCFSIIFLKYVLFHFIFSNQNNGTWLIKRTCFTYLKNCSSITNTLW